MLCFSDFPCFMFALECGGVLFFVVFFFKQKTAYEMRISDWSSDVCSSDLLQVAGAGGDVGLDVAECTAHRVVFDRGEVVAVAEQIGRASCRERVCQYV